MLCIVSYHHEIVVELGEYCFYTLAESLVCPGWRTPVFLIQPIRDFKSYISCLKEVFLNLGTEITFVSKHHTVMIFPTHIIEVMDVMYACRSHVIGMYHTSYPAHSMEFITVIVQTLRGAVSPIRSGLRVVSAHDTTFRPCVLADLYRLGINAEHVLGVIAAKRVKFPPLGDWNVEEIRAVGDRITVTVNGEVILDGNIREACQGHCVGDPGEKGNHYMIDHRNHPGLFNKSGHLGLLGHGAGIQFRNLRVLDLSASGRK